MSFDQVALNYDQQLCRGLSLAGEGPEWFARQRVERTRRFCQEQRVDVGQIVEFGCGTGNHVPAFRATFPGCRITGLDVSTDSLAVARNRFADSDTAFATPETFQEEAAADLIYVNGVFHHIPADEHAGWLGYFRRLIRPGGALVIFDNNPFSLPARVVMKRIPFDRDAVMVNPYRFARLLDRCGFKVARLGFHFIFPRRLSLFRPVEELLSSWPIGAQYGLYARPA